MKIIKAYKCDFCRKVTVTKQAMINHERICFSNPETKSCITCLHFSQSYEDNGADPQSPQYDVQLIKSCAQYQIYFGDKVKLRTFCPAHIRSSQRAELPIPKTK